MNGKLEKTKTAGIYKRGNRYVVVFRDPQGRQRKQYAPTVAEAVRVKAEKKTDISRGEYREVSRETFAEYATRWIETYSGRTAKGIGESTRNDYRNRLRLDAIPFFKSTPLASIEPQHIRDFAAKVAARGCKANTVRLSLAPVKALLACAYEDGVIRTNPAAGVRISLPRESFDEAGVSEEEVKALSPEELALLLDEIPEEWKLFFSFLADTGLRIGEAIELRWSDLDLGAGSVKVSRKFYRGKVGRPKSKFGRRTLRLTPERTRALWNLRLQTRAADGDLVFERGGRIDQTNLAGRVLKPAARRAGVPWAAFHTFRHTCATALFRHGWNAVQVQRWLGHHKPSFTIDTYVHLLDDDTPEAVAIAVGGNGGATQATERGRTQELAKGVASAL